MDGPKISIVIPVLNEGKLVGPLVDYLRQHSSSKNILEIIFVDGGSTDSTLSILGAKDVIVVNSKKGRARQLNAGAKQASGTLLYFLHADTLPPSNFDQLILEAHKHGAETGCFRMSFDTNNPILRFFAWLSRINHTLCRGGDQSLFITKTLFATEGGFNEAYRIYEDSEFITRLYKKTRFTILPQEVVTSARKYRQKGWIRVQYHFGMIHLKNRLGAGPDELYNYYVKKLLV